MNVFCSRYQHVIELHLINVFQDDGSDEEGQSEGNAAPDEKHEVCISWPILLLLLFWGSDLFWCFSWCSTSSLLRRSDVTTRSELLVNILHRQSHRGSRLLTGNEQLDPLNFFNTLFHSETERNSLISKQIWNVSVSPREHPVAWICSPDSDPDASSSFHTRSKRSTFVNRTWTISTSMRA